MEPQRPAIAPVPRREPCGKRLRERLREATGNCGSEATGNCGSGGGTPCSGGANRVRGQQSGAIHGLHSPGLQLRTPARQTKRSHPDSDRASATLHVHESRTRDLVSRSCGSSINPEVICRKNMSYERTVASQNCCIRAHDARRTTHDPSLATGIFACVLNRHPDAQESRQPRPIGVERVSTVRGQRGVITTESYRQYRQPISDGNICVGSRPTSRRTEESRQPRQIGVERVSMVRGQRGVITTGSYHY